MKILQLADHAMRSAPPSVMRKSILPPSRDKHDYFTIAPHELNQQSTEDNPGRVDRLAFQRFADDLVTLALAYHASGALHYAEKGAAVAKSWFLKAETCMNPNAHFAQMREGGKQPNFTGIVEFRNFWAVMDALRIIYTANVLTPAEQQDIAQWLQKFRDSWVSSEAGARASEAHNNIAVAHDLVVASISAFLGDTTTTVSILNAAPLRLHSHVEPYGAQLLELKRHRPLHYSLFNLQLWSNLASLGRATGIADLWRCGETDRRSLAWALRFVYLNRTLFGDYEADATRLDQRIDLLLRTAPRDAVNKKVLSGLAFSSHSTNLVDHHDGVAPLWPWMAGASYGIAI
jgi:hypothetical protein